MNFEYLGILIALLLLTIFLEKKYHIQLFGSHKERLIIIGLFFILCVIWDSFAIWRGHWIFPEGHTLGIFIGLMPLEDYLLGLIVPYFCITAYTILHAKFSRT